MQEQASVQQRYEAALDKLVAKLEQDHYVLAAIVYGSLVRGEVWKKSDIDMNIILRDGQERAIGHRWLTEDSISISAFITTRSRFKRYLDGALQGSASHSIRSQSKILFSKDEAIEAWLTESDRIGARDQSHQLLKIAAQIPWVLDKAEKWFYAKQDTDYSFVWILYAVNALARLEVVLNGEAPGREVIHQALRYNPAFFKAMYTELIHSPKDATAIQQALEQINIYLESHVERIFEPVLGYLVNADGICPLSELNAHFKKKVQTDDLLGVFDWLAQKGIIEKLSMPVRLTKKSQVTLEEPAYYYDGDPTDWE